MPDMIAAYEASGRQYIVTANEGDAREEAENVRHVGKHMADRILVMQEGRIVEGGMPAQLFQNPQHDYTRSLIKAIPNGAPEDIISAQIKRSDIRAGLKNQLQLG